MDHLDDITLPKIYNARPLRMNDVYSLYELGLDPNIDLYDIELDKYKDDEDLKYSNLIIGTVNLNNVNYHIVYKFPHGKKAGVMFNREVSYIIKRNK